MPKFAYSWLPRPPYHPTHGPKSWDNYKLATFSFIKPKWGHRLWIYTRWGALNLDYLNKQFRGYNVY